MRLSSSQSHTCKEKAPKPVRGSAAKDNRGADRVNLIVGAVVGLEGRLLDPRGEVHGAQARGLLVADEPVEEERHCAGRGGSEREIFRE